MKSELSKNRWVSLRASLWNVLCGSLRMANKSHPLQLSGAVNACIQTALLLRVYDRVGRRYLDEAEALRTAELTTGYLTTMKRQLARLP